MTRILIADDHAVAVAGFKMFLGSDSTISEIRETAGEAAILEQLMDSAWDLLLIDIQIARTDGLQLLKKITTLHPDLRVLVVTGLPEELYARSALIAGASGFLSKATAADELSYAVRRVLSGQHYVSEKLSSRMALGSTKLGALPHQSLSARELQVFRLIGAGMMLTAIAEELHLSVKTISTYRARVLEKMELDNNADIVAYIIRHHIFD